MRDKKLLKERDDEICEEFHRLQLQDYSVDEICEIIGKDKRFRLKPSTIRDIVYKIRESRRAKYKHGQRKDEGQLTVGNRQRKE